MWKNIASWIGKLIFKILGWKFEHLPDYWQKRQVLIAFPHTSIADTVMAYAGFAIIKQRGHIMVKKESFVWPVSWLLHALGAIPVDRQASGGLVQQVADMFAQHEEFQLSLVPQGTRKQVAHVKTGFWHIARAAHVQIVCWYIDKQNKCTRWAGYLVPTDDLEKDMEKIRDIYRRVGYEIAYDPSRLRQSKKDAEDAGGA